MPVLTSKSRPPIISFLFSILCQVGAFALALAANNLIELGSVVLLLHGLIAFLLARLLKLSVPWQVFNFMIPFGISFFAEAAPPPWLLALPIVVLALIFIPTFWTSVPYYPTSRPSYDLILEQLPSDRPFNFLDLGSGSGELLCYLARMRPNGTFKGVEISPLPLIISKVRFILSGQRNVSAHLENLWKSSLNEYDFVYSFLAPGPMEKLWKKIKAELRKGSVFLTNSFEVPAKPDAKLEVNDTRGCIIYRFDL